MERPTAIRSLLDRLAALPSGCLARLNRRRWARTALERLRCSFKFLFSHPFVLLPLCIILTIHPPSASALPKQAAMLHQSSAVFGIGCILFYTLKELKFPVRLYTVALVERLLLLQAGLVLVRLAGKWLDQTLTNIAASPATILAGIVALFAARQLLRLPRLSSGNAPGAAGEAEAETASISNEHRQQWTAVHEAGHALVLAGLEELPKLLSIQLWPNGGYRGRVIHDTADYDATESWLRWSMQMKLAGCMAERTALGESLLGGDDDNSNWLATARCYLMDGLGEPFYHNEDGDPERAAHNRAVLSDLKKSQQAELREFFAANMDLLRELAGALLEKNEMGREELGSYLKRVTLTSGLQRVPRGEVPAALSSFPLQEMTRRNRP